MRIILLIIILFFSLLPVNADVIDYIDKYATTSESEVYKAFSSIIKGSASISDSEKQILIDRDISSELNSRFIYVDLEECIDIALGENFDIKIQREVKNEAFWLYRNALYGLLPNVYYNFNISNLGGTFLVGGILPTIIHEVPIESVFAFEWSTINQGRYFFQRALSKNNLKAQKALLEYTREEIILNTVLTYYDTLQKKLEIEVQKVNLYDRYEQLMYTTARFDSGLGTLYDVKRAEAELAGAEQAYTQTLYLLRLHQAALANILGIEVLDAIYPFEIQVYDRNLIDKTFDVESLYQQALESREDIRAKKAEIEMYRAKRSMNYSDIIPAINISYQNGYVGTKRLGLFANNRITLDVRAYVGKNVLMGTITQLKADSAVVKQKKLELINLKRDVKEKIINTYYDSENSVKKIEAAKREVEAADVSLKLSLASMKAGQATFIDVIESQNIKVQANLNLISNMIEYNKAQAQLLFEIGLLSPKNVLKGYVNRFY